MTICCTQYNAFTPTCFGSISCIGCCPVNCCQGPGWGAPSYGPPADCCCDAASGFASGCCDAGCLPAPGSAPSGYAAAPVVLPQAPAANVGPTVPVANPAPLPAQMPSQAPNTSAVWGGTPMVYPVNYWAGYYPNYYGGYQTPGYWYGGGR
jgi:hypothetical protein